MTPKSAIGFVNQTYEAWFNLRRDDILGRKVEEVIGPESYVRAQAHIAAALRGETVTYEMELPYQETQVRYVSGVLVPDFGDQNEVNGYYALIIDITDRKQLERALQASETKKPRKFSTAPSRPSPVCGYLKMAAGPLTGSLPVAKPSLALPPKQ